MKAFLLFLVICEICFATEQKDREHFANLTIYVEPPVSYFVYGMFGHAWLGIEKEDGKKWILGFYPEGIKEDTKRISPVTRSVRFPISHSHYKQLETFFKNPGHYDLFHYNCIDFVRRALEICQIPHPNFRPNGVSLTHLIYDWVMEEIRKQPRLRSENVPLDENECFYKIEARD